MIGKKEFIISNDPSGFVNIADVVRDVILEIRYYSTYNFIGERIDGYEQPVALLKKTMAENGFEPLAEEWWHFTLKNEPFKKTYFDFPVREL